jgi:asparagine synthase (glutamine-hydrolysing)
MCGLSGIFAYSNSALPVLETELVRMRDQMIHRGPDGKGLWISLDERVGLAHRRLAIIDLSENGARPMASLDGRYQIIFNGEIYNFQELRSELISKGFSFRGHSDTEALLALYAQQGKKMCSLLRGMYAFTIWDTVELSLFLARDPFGIKPLYWHDDGNTIRFASQVKSLLAGGGIKTESEPAAEVGYWIWGSVPEPFTLYKDLLSLEAGTWLKIYRGGKRTKGTFQSLFDVYCGKVAAPSPHPDLRSALLDSVRHHLIAVMQGVVHKV